MGIALNNHHPQDRSKPWETIDRGFLVDINIGRWQAETRTTPEDLELDPQHCAHVEALQGLTALGRTYLLPRRVILQLERAELRGRALVNHYSSHVPAGMFMPVTACCRWRAANHRAEAAYFDMRDRICGLMPQLRREVLDGYVRIARQGFDLLRDRGVSVGRPDATGVRQSLRQPHRRADSARRGCPPVLPLGDEPQLHLPRR
ncbi:MAG: hypothetical protein O3A47_13680 [Chloroflexi bacterium]|nr:hypothetical protein [Chloroflexota bacterium]